MRVDFDRRLKLEFHGSKITSDGGLLAYRELDDALGLTEVAGDVFDDIRSGKNGWHGMTGLFRQSVFGRLGGYEDVNDAGRLGRDPAMRWIVGGKAVERQAASASQAIWNGVPCAPAMFIAPTVGATFWNLSSSVTANGTCAATSEGMRPSHHRTSMSFWKVRASSTPSASKPTRFFKNASPIC